MGWKSREIRDDDRGRKFPKMNYCPKHGYYCGKFCLQCRLEQIESGKGACSREQPKR